jgi:6-phosphofructokinase 1
MENSSRDIPSIAAVLVALTVTVISTYSLTNYLRDVEDTKRRLELYQRHVSERKEVRNAKDLPSGRVLTDVAIEKIILWDVENLGNYFPSEGGILENTMKTGGKLPRSPLTYGMRMTSSEAVSINSYNKLISNNECILADLVRRPGQQPFTRAYVRAGPRKLLHFDPSQVNAAIVTCGGLCPGLNNVVREITNTLCQLYDIGGKVYGIRGGFRGFYDPELPPIELNPSMVEGIHHQGGTFLGSSRGGFDLEKTIEFLRQKKINQLYVIGGDGTHRGAFAIYEGCMSKVRRRSCV